MMQDAHRKKELVLYLYFICNDMYLLLHYVYVKPRVYRTTHTCLYLLHTIYSSRKK